MADEEVAMFNYIYATQGKEAAHAYYAYLQGDLNYRQRKADEEAAAAFAKENWAGASLTSIAMSPLKGLSYLGQTMDYMSDGKIDQNAAYNKFSYLPSAIRAEAASKWGAGWQLLLSNGNEHGRLFNDCCHHRW